MSAAAPAPLPEEYPYDADPLLIQRPPSARAAEAGALNDTPGAAPWAWAPMWRRTCTFGPAEFDAVMQNLIRNPNVLSSWLFRADLVAETTASAVALPSSPAITPLFEGMARADDRTIVRRLIPRNTMRDSPMLQTCLFYKSGCGQNGRVHGNGEAGGCRDGPSENHGACQVAGLDSMGNLIQRSLVVYLPHATAPADVPFYHPKVQGVGFLHEWLPMAGTGNVSVHFSFFSKEAEIPEGFPESSKLQTKLSRPVLSRVALSLINTVCKHGDGKRSGYVKRVHHDQLIPQARVQDRYTRLKEKHARRLVATWQEATDPAKHVFEDLAIAAFLMELWADMYGTNQGGFPGFVDVGCGNGLLVHVLNEEGYTGWGFDARKRRSWQQYGNAAWFAAGSGAATAQCPLRESLLLPSILCSGERGMTEEEGEGIADREWVAKMQKAMPARLAIHDGTFPPGTFLIANHADELTVWTPLLAALCNCAFLAIPCCSHNFTGAKFRAPPPSAAAKEATASVSVTLASSSTYASFVEWVAGVATDCGWAVEFDMLRIPSTRNVGLIGRTRRAVAGGDGGSGGGATQPSQQPPPPLTIAQAWDVITKHGGAHGFADNVAKLAAEGKKSNH